jgi:nicotianamine synthase
VHGSARSRPAAGERPLGARRAVHACQGVRAEESNGIEPAEEIRAIHAALRAADADAGLGPRPATDALFSRLVALAVRRRPAGEAERVLADPGVAALRGDLHGLCSRGEHELERYWARRIVDAADPHAELARFPYTGNYSDLARLEVHALLGHLDAPPRRVLFVGPGPMPLSAVVMATEHGVAVDTLDVDPQAVALGAAVVDALGVEGVSFRTGDVVDETDLAGYDAVFLAALVGLEPGAKARVLRRLRAAVGPDGLLLARSAHALRTLLYPDLDVDGVLVPAGFDPLAVVHPYTDVVNSVVLARAC